MRSERLLVALTDRVAVDSLLTLLLYSLPRHSVCQFHCLSCELVNCQLLIEKRLRLRV